MTEGEAGVDVTQRWYMFRCPRREAIYAHGTEAEAYELLTDLNHGKRGCHIYTVAATANLAALKTLANQGNYGKILSEELAVRRRCSSVAGAH